MSDDVLSHIPALRLFARSLTGRYGDADDLVQDTLVRAIASAGSYTPGTNMRAWLFTIMRNRFYNERVKLVRERPGTEDCVSAQPATPDSQYWHVRGREIEAALLELPLSYREAVMLVLVTGESYQSASEILGCDIGTIKSRISRGRRLLQAALGEEV
ncbi:MAG: sigma-70 family RNA polymerase sigma factor [Tabrizicola sp.]|nr:sigma-70 family RNA polymerase sigma factor [Tabrizicola sp.]